MIVFWSVCYSDGNRLVEEEYCCGNMHTFAPLPLMTAVESRMLARGHTSLCRSHAVFRVIVTP